MFAPNSDVDDSIFTLEYADSVPALSKAARQGDLESIRKLLSKGNLPQAPDNRGWTAIHCCVASNQVKALKVILKLKRKSRNYLVNLATWENVTPLHVALKSSTPSLKIVKVLLEAGASPKACTHTKLSPLHLACRKKGNIDFVKLLIRFGADVNVQEDLSCFTPLHFAVCEAQDLDLIRFLIGKCDLNLENIHGRTPFLEACNGNFLEAVQLFLEQDRNLAKHQAAIPPLVYAGVWGNLEMAQLLIQSGADVNQRCKAVVSCNSEQIFFDKESFLPVHSSLANVDVFKLLFKLTKPNEILSTDTKFWNFPLFTILHSKDSSFIEALLQADVPEELKRVGCGVLINYILTYPDWLELVLEKFHLFFKYNFHLEPEDVFQSFIGQMAGDELRANVKLLHLLAQMGISSGDQFLNKNSLIQFLAEQDDDAAGTLRATCKLLSETVLPLKHLSRITVRHHVRSLAGNDWLAVKMVKDSGLPDCLKEFLFFEKVT